MKTPTEYLTGQFNKELRVLVVEARGWKIIQFKDDLGDYDVIVYDPLKRERNEPPKFPTSRDACQELLEDLSDEEKQNMQQSLERICPDNQYGWETGATQICIAYLLTKGILTM